MIRYARLLRSRKLAVLLIAGISAWAVVASSVPGWNRSFSSLPFLLSAAWLLAATAACAWERSKGALRWRITLSRRALRTSPLRLEEAAARLASLGLRISAEGDALIAMRLGLRVARWASPIFHWSLAAGIGLALIGSLIGGAEGVVLIEDTPQRIAVAGRDITLTLAEVRPEFVVDGIRRGQSPRLVTLSEGRNREGWTYPNHPLRVNGFTVHGVASGPAVRLRLTSADGSSVETDVPLAATGSEVYSAGIAVVGGPSLRVNQRPGRRIAIQPAASASSSAAVLAEGESAEVLPGIDASFVRAGTWASVRVVRDPTMPWLALVGGIACLAAAVALLYPARAVSVIGTEEGCAFRIASSRLDPAFSRRVREVLAGEED